MFKSSRMQANGDTPLDGAPGTNRGIVVESLAKTYADTQILKDVGFELHDGEFLTLLGPSGSGKSTALGIIAGFVEPDHGDVRVGENSIATLPPRQRNLGIVFQNYALFPHLTVAGNVGFGLRMRDIPRAERDRRVSEILQRVGLDGMVERKPSQLSGGQQQRVALARALVIDPAALLLDEPLGALDRRLRQQMAFELKDTQRRTGVSVLYVTHDQEEAMVMSDRVAVMHNGRIEQIDTPMAIYKHPTTKFVAEFLGEANFFDVTIEDISRDLVTIRFADGSSGQARLPADQTDLRRNQNIAVCVRPERLGVVDSPDDADNTVSGTIEHSVYLGMSVRYTVRTLGMRVTVTAPDSQRLELPEPGAGIRLGWGVDDGQLLRAEGHPLSTRPAGAAAAGAVARATSTPGPEPHLRGKFVGTQ